MPRSLPPVEPGAGFLSVVMFFTIARHWLPWWITVLLLVLGILINKIWQHWPEGPAPWTHRDG